MLDDILDFFADCFSYIFSFEWIGDIGDFFGSMFENIGDFSIIGLILGFVSFGTIFLLKEYMLNPFLVHMSYGTSLFWMISTYICSFIVGYLLGSYFENT